MPTSYASPEFVATCELDLALTYSMSSPAIARDCCYTAISAAQRAGRPDLASRANDILCVIGAR